MSNSNLSRFKILFILICALTAIGFFISRWDGITSSRYIKVLQQQQIYNVNNVMRSANLNKTINYKTPIIQESSISDLLYDYTVFPTILTAYNDESSVSVSLNDHTSLSTQSTTKSEPSVNDVLSTNHTMPSTKPIPTNESGGNLPLKDHTALSTKPASKTESRVNLKSNDHITLSVKLPAKNEQSVNMSANDHTKLSIKPAAKSESRVNVKSNDHITLPAKPPAKNELSVNVPLKVLTVPPTNSPVRVSQKLLDIRKMLFKSPNIDNPKNWTWKTAEINNPCPTQPTNLVGRIHVYQDEFPISELEKTDFHTQEGGHYRPQSCKARQNVAIIVPYRNREPHLSLMLLNLHPFLQKQQLAYTIFIINQTLPGKFNRGMLMNVGFMEAAKLDMFDCFIFHDVDLLPEDDRNIYVCPDDNPRHFSVAVSSLNYKLPYATIVGGVTGMRWELFFGANGFSNYFFGWGGEDDDFGARLRKTNTFVRYPADIARYTMVKHKRDEGNEPNPKRFQMLRNPTETMYKNGLNSLVYKLNYVHRHLLYTEINVAINQAAVMNANSHPITDFPYKRTIKS